MISITIRATQDGTFTIYRDGSALRSGLTRTQANELAAVLRCISGRT